PIDEIERKKVGAWERVLKVSPIGRRDNFIGLGGDSLSLIRVMQQLRRERISLEIKDLYNQATVGELGELVRKREAEGGGEGFENYEVPANKISEGSEKITPEMLPLIKLSEEEIEKIRERIPGGYGNIQDIY